MTPAGYRELLDRAWDDHLTDRAPDAPTVVSLFAGGGGSSLGYSMAGFREPLAVEQDAHACATLRANFPGLEVWEGDVALLAPEEVLRRCRLDVGELDVLDGSPPCQGFSTAGRRDLEDERNALYVEHVRLLERLRPRATVIENVPGLARGKMRLVLRDMLEAVSAAGYATTAAVLDASWYGVPQRRRRLIVIGVRRDLDVAPSLPAATVERPLTVREVLDLTGPEPEDAREVPPLSDRHGRLWRWVPQGGSAGLFGAGRSWGLSNNCYKPRPGRSAPTIPRMQTGRGYATMVHPTRPRALAVSEGLTLSSFPAAFRIDGRYQDRFARIGNSVPPLFMRAIAAHVRDNVLAHVRANEPVNGDEDV